MDDVRTADAAARVRALDPATSFIVRAPAGSGKTELLIQRYLRLLATVESPESIVAITFTKKAAAEMRSRVIEALRGSREPRPEAEHKRVTWELARAAMERSREAGWRLLENPARVRMQTIDSLCVSITSRMPWVSRFGAMPDIVEKAGPLYKEAARLTLTGPDRTENIAVLLLHLDNNFERAENLLAQMLEKRDQWLRHVSQPYRRDDVENCLRRIIIDTMSDVRRTALDAGLTGLPGEWIEDVEAWQAFVNELLTAKNEWRKKSRLAQSLEGNDALLDAFVALRELPAPQFTEAQWCAMEATIALLPVAAGNLAAVFRERSTVDFVELALGATRALAEPDGPTDLGLALGDQIQHILLDEFQDTSYTHYELLEALTATWEPGDGRTVFLVGDPMQSIYRFRQAEVRLFLQAWRDGLRNVALEPLKLAVNFRSGAEVVEWVNTTFPAVFPAAEDAEAGAVSYSASAPSDASQSATVEVHAFTGDEGRMLEAERVAELVLEAKQHGSVGILVRARSHLAAIVTALRTKGVRYQAIEIDDLGARPLIQDLMALTFALIHPADRISQLAVLRAPWCGLTLEQLLEKSADPRRSRTEAILDHAIGQRGRVSLRRLVQETWMRLGGPACLDSDSDLEDASAYFDVLESVEEGGDLEDFDVLKDQVRDLFAQPDAGSDGAVQIMTIHKAKGLEFDTVVLPGLGSQPKRDENQLILWHEASANELLFAPIPESGSENDGPDIYRYLSGLEQRKLGFEAIRLLYVAVTRARTNLHLLGCAGVRHDGTAYAAAGSFLKILWPVVEAHYRALPAPIGATTSPATTPTHPLRRFVADWRVPEPPARTYWIREGASVAEAPEITYEWVGDALRHVGTVVHAFLARIGREGLHRWTAASIRASEGAMRSMLLNAGMSQADVDAAVRQVAGALIRAVNDERGRWVLTAHDQAQCELAISGIVGGTLVDAVIDRTFVDGEGVRWIVDYKTGAHSGGSVEKFLTNEKARYQEQLERYARLLAQSEGDRPIRLGLYFPLVEPGWLEWPAPQVMRQQASLFAD